jgi:hypothetical protein
MKKLIFVSVFFLLTGMVFGQIIKNGQVVAVGSYEITLKPDVTFNQYLDFCLNKYIPAFEKNAPGIKVFMLWGDRGENKYKLGILIIFESVELRDKYYPKENDTTLSEAQKALNEKMKDLDKEESDKYLISANRTYTDWIVK